MNVSPEKLLLALSGRPVVHDGSLPRPLQFKYRKTVALLGYLVSQPRREVRREQLADLLWPGLDMPAGRANLRVVLADLLAQWRLHRLPDAIQVHRDWIAFQPVAGLGTDMELLAPQRPRDPPAPGPLPAWADLLLAEPDAWLAGAEEGTSEEFAAWLAAQRLRMDAARSALAARAADAPSVVPRADVPTPSAPHPATETAAITLLRVQLPDVAASDHQPSAPALSALLVALGATAQRFGGVVLGLDDAGCTLGFGIDSRHTGQRWQALRCAAGLSAVMPAGQQLSAGATHGWVLVERTPALRAVGWRMRLAERLAQRAEPGELVCDESMADMAQGFGCRPLGPQRFRGLGREFMLFGCRLGDAVTTLPPGGDFAGSSFFGREALVQSLLADLQSPAGGGTAAHCLAGEPGVGKTRTAWELARRWQAQGAPLVWMGGLPEGATVPWRSLHDLVAGLLGGGEAAAERLAALAGHELPAPAREALLGFLETRGVGRRQRADLAEGLLHLLKCQGPQPALVVVDDVQWLDPATAEFLLPLATPQAPLRWLLTLRTGEAHPLPLPGLQTRVLAPLDDAAAQAIVQSLPDAAGLTPQVLRSRVAHARGLPLYLLAGSVHPDSASHFNEFCRALLNRLGAEREGMAAAAVLGMLFSVDDLAALCGQDLAERAFARALETGLVVSRGRGQAAFFHARLREYLLSTSPREALQGYARAAAVRAAGQGRHARAAALWEQGGAPEAAAVAWFQAARHAFAEDDICAACDSYARLAALGYLPDVAGIEARVLHARALIARHGYGSGEAHALVVELGRLALPATLDPVIRFDLQMLAYLGSSSQGEADGLDYARRLQASAHSPVQRFAAAWANGNTLFWLGRFAEARVCLEANLALAGELNLSERMAHFSSDLAVFARGELAWLLWFVGETAAAEAMVESAAQAARASATRQDLCIAQCFRALVAWCRRDQATLAAAAESAWVLADAEGLQFWRGVAGMLVVLAQAHAGMPVDFEAVAAGMAAMQSGYRAAATTEAWFVIDALVTCGRHAEALATVEQTLAVIDLSEHRYCRMELWRLKSVALAALGRPGEAAQALEKAVALGEAAGARGWLAQWRLAR